MIPFIRKLHTRQLLTRAPVLDERSVEILTRRLKTLRTEEEKYLIAITGGPGCGKSTLARHVKREGLFARPPQDFFVIDDLRGPEGERYSKRGLKELIEKKRNKIILVFDYRAAEYVRDANLCIVLVVDENRRIQNLKNRSHRGYRRYGNRMFSVSPIPLKRKSDVYICREIDLLKCTAQGSLG